MRLSEKAGLREADGMELLRIFWAKFLNVKRSREDYPGIRRLFSELLTCGRR